MKKLLDIRDLAVEYRTDFGITKAVNNISLTINKGESLGLVGESGSGKTTTALSILRLLPKPAARVMSGEIEFEGKLLGKCSENEMRTLRGNRISMIFQNPLTSLNPVFTVGEQIAMVYLQHSRMSRKEAMKKAGDMLEIVSIPRSRLDDYPHQFSGGMRQRVGIAAGIACDPGLLIADEPTTALDVTIQLQILELIKEMQKRYSTSMLMITHNLGIISDICQRVAVMYAGTIVEQGTVQEVFMNPKHPYTVGLLGAIPRVEGQKERLVAIPGSVANASALPEGCKFHPRCEFCTEECKKDIPQEIRLGEDHLVACIRLAKEGCVHE